ncbi:MAG: pitrilysin family protein [Verrucomicrobium sp.]|nr:pitrilysin family protein [Verrucomicrobium sp.]
MHFQTAVSAGGLPVVVSEMGGVESVCLGLWFPAGSRYEPARLSGALHFIEHLLFKGTRRRNARQISEAVEGVGGYLNAFTSEEMSCYHAAVPASGMELAFDVLLDMVDHSLFSPEEVERERGVILEEIKMYEDQPSQVVQDRLNALLWPGQALGRPITGTLASVSRLTRAELLACHRRHYDSSRMVVTVAGKTTVPAVLRLLGRRKGRKLSFPRAVRPAYRPAVDAVQKPVEQTHLAIGWPAVSRHDPRRYALKLLSVLLGENMSSRLFQLIRERHGLAYSISSQLTHHHDTGSFVVLAGVENGKALDALRMTLKTVEAVAQKGPATAELRRAQDYVIGQTYLGLEGSTNQMMWAGEGMMGNGSVLQPREAEKRLRAVTAEAVRAVAAQILKPGRASIAAVGPAVDGEALRPFVR